MPKFRTTAKIPRQFGNQLRGDTINMASRDGEEPALEIEAVCAESATLFHKRKILKALKR